MGYRYIRGSRQHPLRVVMPSHTLYLLDSTAVVLTRS